MGRAPTLPIWRSAYLAQQTVVSIDQARLSGLAAASPLDQAAQMATARTSQVMLVGIISTAKAWTRSRALNG